MIKSNSIFKNNKLVFFNETPKPVESAPILDEEAPNRDIRHQLADKNAKEAIIPLPKSELGEFYKEKTEKIDNATTELDIKKINEIAIEDLRLSPRILIAESKNESNEVKYNGIKEETARRIRTFTSKCEDGWFTLDYKNVDKNREEQKLSHELYTGLGEICAIDPDIQNLIVEADGKQINAHRGIVPSGKHKGRLAFLDEDNEYIATYSGDKFKIVSNKATNPKDPNSLKEYIKEIATNKAQKITYSERVKEDIQEQIQFESTDISNYRADIDPNKGPVVDQLIHNLSAQQKANARIIEEEFTKAGVPANIIAAAIVNSYKESGISMIQSRCRGNYNGHEDSWGLFQINIPARTKNKAKADALRERVQDPRENCKEILKSVLGKRGKRLREAAANGASVSELTAIFCYDIEIPAHRGRISKQRAYFATKFFPSRIEDSKPAEAIAGKFNGSDIAFIGDSYAQGQWMAGMSKIIPRERYFGKHSTTTAYYIKEIQKGNQKLIGAIKNSKLVYIKLGGNEYFKGLAHFQTNMQQLTALIKELNPNAQIAVAEMGPSKDSKKLDPAKQKQKDAVNQWIAQGGNGLFRPFLWAQTVADNSDKNVFDSKYNRKKEDDGHLNSQGFRKMNEQFVQEFLA